MGLDGLKSILRQIQEKHPTFRRRLAEAHAVERWETAVGPLIAKHARALRVKVSHDSSRIVACTRDENGFKAYSFQNGKELFLTTPETYHKTVDIVFKSISGIEL